MDDTNLFCFSKNLEHLLNTVVTELTKIKRWFDVNKLSLNISKTKFIIFGNRPINQRVQIIIDNVEVERVFENKFLGVVIDHKLCWKPHINFLKNKISKTMAILHKCKNTLTLNSLKTLYQSLIKPYITYCIEVWGHTFTTITKPILLLQKKQCDS